MQVWCEGGAICCWDGNVCGWPICLNASMRSCMASAPNLAGGGRRGLKGDKGPSSGDGESGKFLDLDKSLQV